MRSRSSSIDADPHRPHADVVVATRGSGTGAAPPVSTLTTLNSVSTALPVPQYRQVSTGRARQQPVAVAQADGQLEVVARRAHGGGDEVVVEADLERLLDDQLVGPSSQRRAVPALREHLRGATSGHARQAIRPCEDQPAEAARRPAHAAAAASSADCPLCGSGGCFETFFQKKDRCPRCNFPLRREEGHWIGALGMNTVVTFGLLVVTMTVG